MATLKRFDFSNPFFKSTHFRELIHVSISSSLKWKVKSLCTRYQTYLRWNWPLTDISETDLSGCQLIKSIAEANDQSLAQIRATWGKVKWKLEYHHTRYENREIKLFEMGLEAEYNKNLNTGYSDEGDYDIIDPTIREMDDFTRDVLDGNPDAYWNID